MKPNYICSRKQVVFAQFSNSRIKKKSERLYIIGQRANLLKNASEIIKEWSYKENIFKVNEKSVIGWIKSDLLPNQNIFGRYESTLYLINFESEYFKPI